MLTELFPLLELCIGPKNSTKNKNTKILFPGELGTPTESKKETDKTLDNSGELKELPLSPSKDVDTWFPKITTLEDTIWLMLS